MTCKLCKPELTDREHKVFHWLKAYIKLHGHSPLEREVAGFIGNLSLAKYYLHQLEAKKVIHRYPHKAYRNIVITSK